MAYFGYDDETFGGIILIIETLLVIALTIAVIEARRLRTHVHRRIVIVVYIIQILIVLIWMGRSFLDASAISLLLDTPLLWTLTLHVTIGIVVLMLAGGWIIAMTVDPDIHVAKMKRGKPLMRTIYVLWVFNYLLGAFNYFNTWRLHLIE
ncbi:MAG: hypothetical protein IH840_01815 [Candidatus Heimdallarchaeota archaeon]|nr:hypothetical protein [Candidatus Heimdallarchaeota archaeon]